MLSEPITIAILSIFGMVFAGFISFILGRQAERRKQSLMIRAEMLKPVDEWLKGAEKMVGILSDTLVSVAHNSPLPISYNLDDRRKASNFMAEKTNEIFGIFKSKSLQIRETKRLSNELGEAILSIDGLIKFQLLPMESNIVDLSSKRKLTNEHMLNAAKLKVELDSLLQLAYSLVAQIKASLT